MWRCLQDCEAVATCAPGSVERVLKLLRTRLEEFDSQHPGPRSVRRLSFDHEVAYAGSVPMWRRQAKGRIRRACCCETAKNGKLKAGSVQVSARQPARKGGADGRRPEQ